MILNKNEIQFKEKEQLEISISPNTIHEKVNTHCLLLKQNSKENQEE